MSAVTDYQSSGRTAVRRQLSIAGLILSLAGASFLGGAPALRILLPLSCAVVAAVLIYKQHIRIYVTFCLWLFLLVPLLRRIIDYKTSFDPTSPVLATPYVAGAVAMLCAASLLSRRPPRLHLAFGLLFVGIVYGFLMGVVQGKFFAASYDLLRWTVPPSMALLILLNAQQSKQLQDELQAFAMVSVPLLALYGIFQFYSPAPWDALWLEQVKELGVNTFGNPEPFEIRVFGTMGSPHAFGAFLVFGIATLLVSRAKLRWAGIVLGCAALALTAARTWWIGLGLCLAMLVAVAPATARSTILKSFLGLLLLLPLIGAVPEAANSVQRRLETFQALSSDTSLDDRRRLYSKFLERMEESPAGRGFGITGAYQKQARNTNVTIDSGIVEALTSFGIFMGALYLVSLGTIIAAALFGRQVRGSTELAPAWRGIVLAFAFAMTSLTSSIAEIGVFFWIAMACSLSARPAGHAHARPFDKLPRHAQHSSPPSARGGRFAGSRAHPTAAGMAERPRTL